MRRREMILGVPALLAANDPALRALAAARGIAFGSEVLWHELANDADYAALVARECAILVPGLEAKWDHVEPAPGRFDFAALDALLDWAARHGMAMRLHTLIWSLAMPDWLRAALAAGGGRAAMQRHIAAVAGRYAGRVRAWDVANEITDPRWHLGPEGLTLSPWRQALGPEYVAMAFRMTAAADPRALLFLNDDDLEYDAPDREAKRALYLRLIEAWLRQGVPIGGFGLQAHLKPDRPFAGAAYRRFIADLAGFGLELHVTELDVQDHMLPADVAVRDRMIDDCCRRYLDIVLDEKAVRALLVWGLSARYTYLNTDPAVRRADGLEPRGLLYDRALQPTPMRGAVAAALRGARSRA
jgi:endo-1,4-beta-xylanase